MTRTPANRQALLFIGLTILIDMIGFGIVLPVTPELIMELTGEGLSRASEYGGWLAFAFAIMQFLCGPIMGNLSDRFGRRPVLLASLLAFGLDYLLMGLSPSLTWLFVGRALAGVAGAAHTPANAYIADISPPEERAQNFGLMGAAFGLGFILGPAWGGLLGERGPRAPFFVAAGAALVNALYGWLVLPESLPRESRRPFSWKRASLLGTWRQMSQYPVVMGLAGVMFLWQLAHQSLPTTWAFFSMLRFGWSEAEVGASLAFAGLTMALVQGGLSRKIIPRIGERRAAWWGLWNGATGLLGYAFCGNSALMYVLIAYGAPSGLVFPSLRGLMSREIPHDAQGELQGGISSVYALTTIIGPVMMTQLFGFFTRPRGAIYFPGAAFGFAALLTFAAIAQFWRMERASPPISTA